MNTEIALWDQIGLGLVLVYVAVYIFFKIKKILSPSTGGCGGCSGGSCSVRPMCGEEKKPSITTDEIQKNIIVK